MARIKVEDLPVLEDLDAAQTKGIFGGALKSPSKDAFVPSYDIPGSRSEDFPTEEPSLTYDEDRWTYNELGTEQDSEKASTPQEWQPS